MDNYKNHRRDFIKTVSLGSLSVVAGAHLLSGCGDDKDEDKPVSPPEDLMQEHGLLNRVLLIYDKCKVKLLTKEDFASESLYSAANVIRAFVEDYHEKQEEHYLFPRFQKANRLTGLVAILLQQHQAGRTITNRIIQLCKPDRTENENVQLIDLLTAFSTMYRPHEAREDTVLFPAFREIVSKHEYNSLGEEFEKNEQKHFGADGFEAMVNKVASIEKALGIYELSQFTPKL